VVGNTDKSTRSNRRRESGFVDVALEAEAKAQPSVDPGRPRKTLCLCGKQELGNRMTLPRGFRGTTRHVRRGQSIPSETFTDMPCRFKAERRYGNKQPANTKPWLVAVEMNFGGFEVTRRSDSVLEYDPERTSGA